ncbi:putative serine threonine-protein kinase vps15-like protein [Lasius niger]|uniref:Putative serine threonine-protein kinase vps15-like protein n=1 Tax=Lasius niger TaxID=67767 RepID=A0A0J7JV75_LASNI|nr:putative serine threonine-protein kinase vps15-like protein [Lasius niger]
MIRQQKQQHDRLYPSTSGGLRSSFELEIKDAQNISFCRYSVEPIPDIRGTRMPKDLVHIKCNVIGNKCLNTGDIYCCIQTYRNVEVSYSDGESETLKIYTGCIYALNNSLPLVQSNNPYND